MEIFNKKINAQFLWIVCMFFLSGCGSAIKEDEILQKTVFTKNGDFYSCSLQSEDFVVASADGRSVYECWYAAAQQVENPETYGLMNRVFIEYRIPYAQIKEIAAMLQSQDTAFPKLQFFMIQSEKQEIDYSVKGTSLPLILNSENSIVLPDPKGESAWIVSGQQNNELTGAQASAAMALAGQKKKFETLILCEGEYWQVNSDWTNWYVQLQPAGSAQLMVTLQFSSVYNLQTGRAIQPSEKPLIEKALADIFSGALETAGKDAYGLLNLLAIEDPKADPNIPVCVKVRLSETL